MYEMQRCKSAEHAIAILPLAHVVQTCQAAIACWFLPRKEIRASPRSAEARLCLMRYPRAKPPLHRLQSSPCTSLEQGLCSPSVDADIVLAF